MVQAYISGDMPIHIAMSLPLKQLSVHSFWPLIELAIDAKIPIITLGFPSSNDSAYFDLLEECFSGFDVKFLQDRQIKVSILGKWYSLPDRVINPIKNLMDQTKDFDRFFVNLCINYDGHTEIVDATKLLMHQVKSGRIDVESIGQKHIKNNLYTSSIIHPNVIVKVGRPVLDGFLLWDSRFSLIYFHERESLSKEDLVKVFEWYKEKGKKN